MKVAIIGAGIGGMTAALALCRRGVDVTVYEQARELREVGAGLRVTPNATRILCGLGLGNALERNAFQTNALVYRRWQNGAVLAQQKLGRSIEAKFGFPYYHVHRASLHQLIAAALPAGRVVLDRKCMGIEQAGERLALRFERDDRAEADVVIGADGMHSVVREQLHGRDRPRFSGDVAYRGLIPAERAMHWIDSASQNIWVGPSRHFVQTYAGPRYVNIVALVPGEPDVESWSRQGSLADLKAHFDGWDARIHELIDHTDQVMCWPLYDRDPLERWTEGRITLLGDAAHPMLPYLGQGAAQAIEDGALIAQCLAAADAERDIPGALQRYEHLRRARTARVQLGARSEGNVYHLPDGEEQRRRDAAFQEITGANTSRDEWLFAYDVLGEAGPTALFK